MNDTVLVGKHEGKRSP